MIFFRGEWFANVFWIRKAGEWSATWSIQGDPKDPKDGMKIPK
jgi:hypothetical protein